MICKHYLKENVILENKYSKCLAKRKSEYKKKESSGSTVGLPVMSFPVYTTWQQNGFLNVDFNLAFKSYLKNSFT